MSPLPAAIPALVATILLAAPAPAQGLDDQLLTRTRVARSNKIT